MAAWRPATPVGRKVPIASIRAAPWPTDFQFAAASLRHFGEPIKNFVAPIANPQRSTTEGGKGWTTTQNAQKCTEQPTALARFDSFRMIYI